MRVIIPLLLLTTITHANAYKRIDVDNNAYGSGIPLSAQPAQQTYTDLPQHFSVSKQPETVSLRPSEIEMLRATENRDVREARDRLILDQGGGYPVYGNGPERDECDQFNALSESEFEGGPDYEQQMNRELQQRFGCQ